MNNLGMLINLIRNGGNPQNIAMNMLREAGGDNPVVNNAIGMIQNGDMNGIKTLCENLCRERGTTPEKLMKEIQNQYGFK